MIYIRDDDVLLGEFAKFKRVHDKICRSPRLMHRPAIVVSDIQKFDDGMLLVEEETKEGRMLPEIHGLEHIDYAKIPFIEIKTHLYTCVEFIENKFSYTPLKWYTPWGADTEEMRRASKEVGLELVNCENRNKLRGEDSVWDYMKQGNDMSYIEGQAVFMHYWDKFDRERLGLFVDYLCRMEQQGDFT